MYLYKEFCDENAYGEEIVELYESKYDAVSRLRERIEGSYGVSLEDIPEELALTEDDVFQEDYVSIHDERTGTTCFGIVEEIVAKKATESVHEPVLCGFVWCHGYKNFAAYEVQIKKEDRDAIERILEKYDTSGSSESNVWDQPFSEVFSPDYKD